MGAKHERTFLGHAGAAALYTTPPLDSPSLSPPWTHDGFATAKELRLGAQPSLAPSTPSVLIPPIRTVIEEREDGMFHSPCARPLRVEHEVRVAPPVVQRGWGDGAIDEPLVAGLDDETRRVLGEAWLRDALDEHAAVGAFGHLMMTLLALGAPRDLVLRTQQASLQEVEHARLCFSLASVYLGAPFGPGPLAGGVVQPMDIVALALASYRDGCLGEGAAAAIARAARRRAHDPAVCAALTTISRDEGAHAELSWDVVSFCLMRGGRPVSDALREAVARTRAPEVRDRDDGRGLTALLAEHGRLSAEDRARSAADATRTAVRRAGWLLAPGGVSVQHAAL